MISSGRVRSSTAVIVSFPSKYMSCRSTTHDDHSRTHSILPQTFAGTPRIPWTIFISTKKHSSTTWTSAGVVFLSGPYVDLLRSFLFVTFKLSSSGIFCSSSPDDHRKQRSSASSCVRLSSSHCVTSPTKIPPLAECIQRSTDMHRLNRNARRLHNSMCHARPIQARFVMDVPF